LSVVPQPLRAPSHPLAAGKAVAPGPGVLTPFGNDQRNSRIPIELGQGTSDRPGYGLRWSVEIPEPFHPYALLQAANRILVLGPALWRLYDRSGSLIQEIPRSGAATLIHPAWSVFFAADNFGLIDAYRISDGETRFKLGLRFGKEFSRTFIGVRGNRLIALSIEKLIDMHGPNPERSIIEAVDLGDPAFPKSWNEENGPHVVKDLIRQSQIMYAAMAGDNLAIATVDRIYLMDLDLNIHRAMTGSFLPTDISRDEEGRIYLLVYAEKRNALWLVTPEGERVYSFVFPASFTKPISPPIVGYDHTAFIVSTEHVLSIALDGKLNWMRPGLGPVAGATFTPDGFLLVSEGTNLSAWDARGRRTILHTFETTLATPPILLENSDLLVASGQRLYCLTRGNGRQPVPGPN
jgi:hypothetical protein